MVEELIGLMLVDFTFKKAHENQEEDIIEYFTSLLKSTTVACIDCICTDYDYEDDLYLVLSCSNKYCDDVAMDLEAVLGYPVFCDVGDNYSEFKISLKSLIKNNYTRIN